MYWPLFLIYFFYSFLIPVEQLPAPGGPYPVATRYLYFTDLQREETFTQEAADKREIMVQVWYPAQDVRAMKKPLPYVEKKEVSRALVRRLNHFFPLPDFALDYLTSIPTHSYPDLPMLTKYKNYPVILFSHGYFIGRVWQNTVLMEELASHGYLVFSIAHAYETPYFRLPDGRHRYFGITPELQRRIREMKDKQSDQLFARLSLTKNETEQRKLFQKAFQLTPAFQESVEIWAADLGFVMEQLQKLNQENGFFYQKIDLDKIGVIGMSFGGAASGEFCLNDKRCRVGINLDGKQYGHFLERDLEVPFLFMYSEKNQGVNDLFMQRARSKVYTVTLPNTIHFHFSDLAIMTALNKINVLAGRSNGFKSLKLINLITLDFLDKYLKKRQHTIFDQPQKAAKYPEILIESNNSRP